MRPARRFRRFLGRGASGRIAGRIASGRVAAMTVHSLDFGKRTTTGRLPPPAGGARIVILPCVRREPMAVRPGGERGAAAPIHGVA